jgi:hypothetical protein
MLSIINLQPPRPSNTILGINVGFSAGIFTVQDAYARNFRRREIRRLIPSRPADASMLSRQESATLVESRQPPDSTSFILFVSGPAAIESGLVFLLSVSDNI